ncbi:hypothetical protein MKW94_020496, partial [Papaver nudicaule]|nr:hypothetical protein [Papaver nudicaule]
MARFRCFSCFRTSKGKTEESLEGKHGYGTGGVIVKADQPKFVRCVTNARESKELIVAIDTSDQRCCLGEHLYKGFLENGQEVAVKMFRFDELPDFRSELTLLKGLEHSNLVKMTGYCDRGEYHVIVYEFIPCGSLNLHLHDLQPGKKPLHWKTRMKIAHGVAKALEYLHHQQDPPCILSGVRYTSILLDKNYNPKLTEFSCATPGPKANCLRLDTRLMQRYGYIAPEYAMSPILTLKSDVYGFGILLLELISGEKPVGKNIRGSGMTTIVSW